MSPKANDELECHEDTRKEAKDYDGHAVGLFKTPSRGENKTLVGHVPIEISSLIDYFLKADKSNSVSAQVTGKRKREVGLVVHSMHCNSKTSANFGLRAKQVQGKVCASGTNIRTRT